MTRPRRHFDRRDLLKLLALGGGVTPFVGGLSPLWPLLDPQAMAGGATPRRFLQIFLEGGWDSVLATEPAQPGSAKALGGGYQSCYYSSTATNYVGASVPVPGKSNLIVGAGLAAAAPAFAQAPTAFVNGIYLEVTAHQLATNYMYSGTPSLSNTRTYPAIIATMADNTGGFPAHIILGDPIPLAATAATNPPLQSGDIDSYVSMLGGPYKTLSGLKPATIAAAHTLISQLDSSFQSGITTNQSASLSAWDDAEGGLAALYAQRFDQQLTLSTAMSTAFNASSSNSSIGAKLGMALQSFAHGVSSFITVNTSGFDTHRNHLATHLPLQQSFAAALNTFVNYLATTNDPDSPSMKLLETTTVLVSSEFTRTPLFNLDLGTDHRQSASCILLGRGVRDNTVLGSTDQNGAALNYNGTQLLPDHVMASVLRMMGFSSAANLVSTVNLDALFT